MNILMTGGSSFTGFWFVQKLLQIFSDAQITCVFRSPYVLYQGIRKMRIDTIKDLVECRFSVSFGSEDFIKLIRQNSFDIFLSHGAFMDKYRDMDYPYALALAKDTEQLHQVLTSLQSRGCRLVMYSGSIFEPNEGVGSEGLRALSPYGVLKQSVFQFYKFFCYETGLHLGKFVIPNPFGSYEEHKLTLHLMKHWLKNKVPSVSYPHLIRDNIPVDALAEAYVWFIQHMLEHKHVCKKLNPSYYINTQENFCLYFAKEVSMRLQKPCDITFIRDEIMKQPKIRVNDTPIRSIIPTYSEQKFWDDLVHFYQKNIDLYSKS